MSVRQLAALLDTLPLAFVAHDADGHVELWNPAAEALLGWKRDEVLGRRSPLPADLLSQPVPASRAHVPLYSVMRRDGSVIEVALATMPLQDQQASAQVMWEPLHPGGALEEGSLRALFESVSDGALLVDGAGVVLGCNQALAHLLATTRERVVGHSVDALLEVPRGEVRPFGGLPGLGPSVLLRRPRGDQFLAKIQAAVVGPERCVAFVRDVTAAERADLERRLFARVFDSAGEAMLITDARNTIIAVNPAFTRITGYALDEVLGKNPKLLSSGRHDRVFYEDLWATLQQTGTWRGELWNRRKSGEVYCEVSTISAITAESGEVTHFVAVFADVTQVRDAEAALTYLAQRDHLTGLPNRSLLTDRLTQALHAAERGARQVALLVIDLDGFKSVNGSLGPAEGDELLKQVGSRLEAAVRAGDTVARLGGDEFAIVLTTLESPAECLGIEERVRGELAAPLQAGGQELRVTASIGVALFPQDGATADELLRHGEAAMYAAKEAGRDTTRFYSARMNESAAARLKLVQDLGRAAERNELHLHYQPQRRVQGDGLIGVEALLRWTHPTLGEVMPDSFIHLAEETGLIRPIGLWVLREAALRAKAWRVPVSVNVSVVQLSDPHFVEQVEQVLGETGVSPKLLELEVTESVVMKDPVASAELLTRLTGLGLGLAMDDFGTGYSSLAQLKRLPLDRLKIDRAFVRDLLTDPADQVVVQAVIAMGHALGLRIIAEGVELADQRAMLETLGCDEIQGYWCGRPGAPQSIDEELGRPSGA